MLLTTKVQIRVYYFSFMVFVFYSFNINTHTILSVQRLVCTKLSACSQSIIYTTLSSIDSSYTLKIQYFKYYMDTLHPPTHNYNDNPEIYDIQWLRRNRFHRNRPTYARNTVNEVYAVETTC